MDIGSLVSKFIESDSPRKTALQNILGEFLQAVWINRLVIKLLHLFILVEAQGIKLERNVSAGQLGDKLTAQKIGIRSRNENGKIAVFTKTVNDSLELANILDFINEQILAPGERCIRSDKRIQCFSGLYMAIAPAVQIQIDEVIRRDPACGKFTHDGLHQAGFAAASDPGDDFDHIIRIIKSTNFG